MSNPPRQQQPPKANYQIYFFSNGDCDLFLQYNHTHPVSTQLNFHVGNVTIFMKGTVYKMKVSSAMNLNKRMDWDKAFFDKLMNGFQDFEIHSSGDEEDNTLKLKIRHKQQSLLQAKLVEEFGADATKQFWRQFSKFNEYQQEQIKKQEQKNLALSNERDKSLTELMLYQQKCQEEKNVLLGQLSAIYREKVSKLKQLGQQFQIQDVQDKEKHIDQPRAISATLQERQFGGSLFQQSQFFYD